MPSVGDLDHLGCDRRCAIVHAQVQPRIHSWFVSIGSAKSSLRHDCSFGNTRTTRHLRRLLLQLRDRRLEPLLRRSLVGDSAISFISRSTSGRCCTPHRLRALHTKCTWHRCQITF